MDSEKVDAFYSGYSRQMPMERHNIADALYICRIIETPWWILPGCFAPNTSTKVQRFRDEILWLTRYWDKLDRI